MRQRGSFSHLTNSALILFNVATGFSAGHPLFCLEAEAHKGCAYTACLNALKYPEVLLP